MPPSWRSYRDPTSVIGSWVSVVCPGADRFLWMPNSAAEPLFAMTRKCGATWARVAGPRPRTRRRISSIDLNGRICRCSTNCLTRLGPTCGKDSRTSGGAELGSTMSAGTIRHVRLEPVPEDSPANRRATPETSKMKASSRRALAGNVHDTTTQTPPRVFPRWSRRCLAELNIRYITLDAGLG